MGSPVAEMQFADFISCAWDTSSPWLRTALPRRNAGRHGSPALGRRFLQWRSIRESESSFAHIPGLKCVCPATPEDAKGLLISAIEDPILFSTSSTSISTAASRARCPKAYTVPLGKARTHREGDDVSVITWGAMVYTPRRQRNNWKRTACPSRSSIYAP
jgi:pyruvate/2-oxoglutarate/acetoin dehydrogenase E1 component